MSNSIPSARPMRLSEADVIIDYFHGATPEFLHSLGVDPAKLPPRERWRLHYAREFGLPVEERKSFLVLWAEGETPVGFSIADKIKVGDEAYMHLHILKPQKRRSGFGTKLVQESAAIYFDALRIRRLFCEPYAFNQAPNRTLQRAGFRYVMTHETAPGPLNFPQAVTRWVLERP